METVRGLAKGKKGTGSRIGWGMEWNTLGWKRNGDWQGLRGSWKGTGERFYCFAH